MKSTQTNPNQLRNKEFNAKVKGYMDRGFSKQEAADVMGCSTSTIKRAMDDLKPKKVSKPVAKKTKVTSKAKTSNKRTSSFSILWGAISFSRTTTAND